MRIEAKDIIEENNSEHLSNEKAEGNEAAGTDTDKKEDEKEENVFADDALALAGLSLKERRKYKKEVLKKRLATMDKKEGRKYFFYYYRGQLIAAVVILLLVSTVGRAAFKAAIPTPLKLAVVNFGECPELIEYIPEHYREFFDLGKFNDFRIETGYHVSAVDEPYVYGQSMSDMQRLSYYCDPTLIGSDVLDVMIVNYVALSKFLENGDITTIDYVLSDELYEKVKDDIVTTDDVGYKEEGITSAPIAIEITDTQFAKDCNLNNPHVYLILPRCKTKNDKHVENFVRFVYGYK